MEIIMRTDMISRMQSRTVRIGSLFTAIATLSLTVAWADHGGDRDDNNRGRDQGARYQQVNLVSDQPGIAQLLDTNLVNAWGISFGPATPFWVSDNGSGLSTLYVVTNDSSGMTHVVKRSLEVSIPGDGTPTGQLFNSTDGFNKDLFIFASEDGTISGWRPALGTAAETLVPGSSDNVYKGITLVMTSGGPVLLAANFRQGSVDMFDASLNLLGQFKDSHAPADYAPFNVRAIDGLIYVTFAKQDDTKHDDVAGAGNGLIDIFNPMTGDFQRLATGTDAGGRLRDINSPWAIAVSPENFGRHDEQLLVGNFGSGTIMTFNSDGRYTGLIRGTDEKPLTIDGLWALTFGNGTSAGSPNQLFFSAGPDGESHGLFGVITPVMKHDDKGRGQRRH
jgi:uncharacterized protein (TIGR03118 family)